MITPVRRGEIEQFEPVVQAIEENPELAEAHAFWREKRAKASHDQFWRGKLAKAFDKPVVVPYDLSYMHGQTASGDYKFPDHQTKLSLKPFKQAWQQTFRSLWNTRGKDKSETAEEA